MNSFEGVKDVARHVDAIEKLKKRALKGALVERVKKYWRRFRCFYFLTYFIVH